jgi:hypothetical protein
MSPDPDSADGGEELTPADAWETFETLLRFHVLQEKRQRVNDALYALEVAIETGRRPTADEVATAREELDMARALVEDYYADLAIDADPWGAGAGQTVPYGVLADHLEAAGYRVARPGEDVVLGVDLAAVRGEGCHDREADR